MSIAWPDVVIAAIILMAAVQGLRRGFVAELAGAVAFIVAIVAAFRYSGAWDQTVAGVTRLGPGSAHVVAMVLFALLAYIIVGAVASLLRPLLRLPFIGIGNALLGALIGALKGAAFVWAILYVSLFFPLSRDLRADLHRSVLAQALTSQNRQLDEGMRSSLPWYVRPFSADLFNRHRV